VKPECVEVVGEGSLFLSQVSANVLLVPVSGDEGLEVVFVSGDSHIEGSAFGESIVKASGSLSSFLKKVVTFS